MLNKKSQRGQRASSAIQTGTIARPLGQGEPWREEPRNTIVLVKNNADEDVDRFGVLGIDGVAITPDDNESEFKGSLVLEGSTPDLDAHCGRYVITQEPIAAGQIGRCAVVGLTVVRLEAAYGASYGYADAIDGDHEKLKESPIGIARILYKQSGDGDVWALVLLGDTGPQLMRVRLNDSLASGSASADLLDLADGTDTDIDVTVTDVLGAFVDLEAEHECLVLRQGCLNVVKQAGCP